MRVVCVILGLDKANGKYGGTSFGDNKGELVHTPSRVRGKCRKMRSGVFLHNKFEGGIYLF